MKLTFTLIKMMLWQGVTKYNASELGEQPAPMVNKDNSNRWFTILRDCASTQSLQELVQVP